MIVSQITSDGRTVDRSASRAALLSDSSASRVDWCRSRIATTSRSSVSTDSLAKKHRFDFRIGN